MQRLAGVLLFCTGILSPIILRSAEIVPMAALKFTPDRLALVIRYVNKSDPRLIQVYGCYLMALLVTFCVPVLLELEARKKDDSRFTLVVHLIAVFAALVGLNGILHALTILIIAAKLSINGIGIALLPLLITTAYAGLRIALWEKPVISNDKVDRGIEVIFDDRRSVRRLAKLSEEERADGIMLHDGFRLPIGQETKHTLLIASPGAGKTQVIYPLIERIRERGDGILVYDFKGDFTAAFGEDRGVVILSPFDERGWGWDIAADITTDLKALEFAACLMPDHQAKEPFFKKAAQDLLAGVITQLIAEKGRTWTLNDLVEILGSKPAIIAACVKYRSAALSALGPPDDKQASGVFGELRTGSILLEFLARAWPPECGKISLSAWVNSEERRKEIPIIMLRGNQQFRKLDGFLTSLVCSLVIKDALSLPDSYKRRIWAILDEFGNLPKIEGLDALLTGVRSKGVRIVAAIQDIAQIEETYSKAFAQTFFNCFGIIMAGLCSGATARYLSDAFGKNKIARVQHSKTRRKGALGQHGGVSLSESEQTVIENALIDTDFANLAPPSLKTPASFWLRMSGWPISRLSYPVKPLPTHYKPTIEPSWLHESAQPMKSKPVIVPELVRGYQPFRRNDQCSP